MNFLFPWKHCETITYSAAAEFSISEYQPSKNWLHEKKNHSLYYYIYITTITSEGSFLKQNPPRYVLHILPVYEVERAHIFQADTACASFSDETRCKCVLLSFFKLYKVDIGFDKQQKIITEVYNISDLHLNLFHWLFALCEQITSPLFPSVHLLHILIMNNGMV